MSTIKGIFEPFYKYVTKQLNKRKEIVRNSNPNNNNLNNPRHSEFFKVFTEKQCTIRMASGVDLKKDQDLLEPQEGYLMKAPLGNYSGLARQYVLEGGTQFQYQYGTNKAGEYFQGFGGEFGGTREGFSQHGKDENNPATVDTGKRGHTYGDINVRANAQDGFGIVPMPGITNAEVTTKSQDGSLREARVNFICFNRRQLEVLEALYMRPGYPVLLEWGWVPYINNSGKVENDELGFIDKFFHPDANFETLNKEIRDQKKYSGGNYDGFIGFIKNFTFKVREDGGYDCVTELIAQGELLESLKAPLRLVPTIHSFKDYNNLSEGDYKRHRRGQNINQDLEPVDAFLYFLRAIKSNLARAGDSAVLRLRGTDKQNVEGYRRKTEKDTMTLGVNLKDQLQYYNDQGEPVTKEEYKAERWFTQQALDNLGAVTTEKTTWEYVDEQDRPLNIQYLNQISTDYLTAFSELKELVADVAKVSMDQLDFNQERFDLYFDELFGDFDIERLSSDILYGKGNDGLPVDTNQPSVQYMDNVILQAENATAIFGCMNPDATNYNINATKDDGSCVGGAYDQTFQVGRSSDTLKVENKYGNRLGFYSLLENTILKEVVAKEQEYSGEGEDKVLEDSGIRKRIYVRWDLICQIFNLKVIPHYQENTPLAELTYLHPNQPTYSTKKAETKLDNSNDKDHPGGYNYIKYSAPTPLPEIFPKDKDRNYPPTLGSSFDLDVCIMPHQWGGFRKAVAPAAEGFGFAGSEYGDTSVDITPGIEQEKDDKNFTSFKKVNTNDPNEIHSIGLVFFNLDYLIKTYEENVLEEYKTSKKTGEVRYKRRAKKNYSLHDWITTIWNDVNDACGGYYDFGLHVEHERPNVARIVDFTLSGRPSRPIFEFNPQGLDSIARDNWFQSKLDSDFSSAISIAAQAPNDIQSLDALSFKAFHKNIRNRFTSPELSEDEKAAMIEEAGKQYEDDLKTYANTLDSLGYYIRKLNSSNYNSEMVQEKDENGAYLDSYHQRKAITPSTAKSLASTLEEQRIKLMARYPRYDENMNPYNGLGGDSGSLHYKGEYKKNYSHYRNAIIPLTTTIKIDGIGGIIPLQIFKINPEKLPKGYQNEDIVFVVKNEKQTLTAGQDWTTDISGYLSLLNKHKNLGTNNLEGEPVNSDYLDSLDDINYAEELRKLMAQYGHVEKIGPETGLGQIDEAGDIDEKMVIVMSAIFEEISKKVTIVPGSLGMNPTNENIEKSQYYDFNPVGNSTPKDFTNTEPFQKLYITAGNDIFHHDNGGVADSKHKEGLAIDFRLISNNATGNDPYPEDNYKITNEGQIEIGNRHVYYGDTPGILYSRGGKMITILQKVLKRFPGCTFSDDYRKEDIPDHFHIQCDDRDWSSLGIFYIPPTERNPIL